MKRKPHITNQKTHILGGLHRKQKYHDGVRHLLLGPCLIDERLMAGLGWLGWAGWAGLAGLGWLGWLVGLGGLAELAGLAGLADWAGRAG